jgi:murein DD-endopeptidase MepM/ murein hydrolase activator NlpD
MHKILRKIAVISLIFGTMIGIGYADESPASTGAQDSGARDWAPSVIPVSELGTDADAVSSASEQEVFLQRLQQELDISKAEYFQITSNIRETRNRIDSLKDDVSELQNQMAYFDEQIETTQEKLFSVIKQIVKAENEIRILYEEIDIKEVALAYQKTLLKDYIRELYIYGDTYLEISDDGELDAFKMLLSDGNTGDILKEIKYLGILEETGVRLVETLDGLVVELEEAQVSIEEKRHSLEKLEFELSGQKENLETQKAAKMNLLAITKNQDEIYRELLKESMEQQTEVLAEIKAYKETLEFLQEKIVEEGVSFDISEYEDMVGKRFMTIYEFHSQPSSGEGFVWPVMPERGLSAFFHDPGYRGVFGVQHNAVDVRASQGTPVFAASEGVVYAAKDNDYGYSYVMVVHHDDLMTIYGHISNILVEEGQVVGQGTVLGLSGGMPGTKGAGYMTTGPHLHFEVMKNGVYVDPLRFLPLEVLTEEHMEFLPEEYMDDWERSILNSDLLL